VRDTVKYVLDESQIPKLWYNIAADLPAPEANHAVRGAIVEAMRCKIEGKADTIVFNLCGHGHFDMQAYTDYLAGKLVDQPYDEAELAMALAGLPSVPA
jgi:tryptophan synthase beta chain